MKVIVLFVLIHTFLLSSEIFFLPKESFEAKASILKHIKNAKKSIDISIYNFKSKDIFKKLKKAKKRGVDIMICYHKSDLDFTSFKTCKVKNKLHTKMAIFDKTKLIFGSLNWTKKSFNGNYEMMYVTSDKKLLQKSNNFFKNLIKD